jgi:hypothetical protein
VRAIGFILVILGALALGHQSLVEGVQTSNTRRGPMPFSAEVDRTLRIPPVVGGIALVTGLILLVHRGPEDD